jgi:hypothetical protein
MKLDGHEIYQLTEAQLAQWRKAVAPLTARWAGPVKNAGWNPDEVLAGLKASLARHNSTVN